jgi:hypothetical protein
MFNNLITKFNEKKLKILMLIFLIKIKSNVLFFLINAFYYSVNLPYLLHEKFSYTK